MVASVEQPVPISPVPGASDERALARSQRNGVLLINLGTPASPTVRDVRRYLREFLMDPRVIDIPGIARWLLVHLAILPTRPQRSAAAYRSVWMADGSPLLVHERALARGLAGALGDRWVVQLGMRYGEPSIAAAMRALIAADVAKILVVPLFPQYAGSSTGSALERVYAIAAAEWNVPPLEVLGEFYDDPGFIHAFAEVARPPLAEFRADHVVFSYHGLPERQVRRSDVSGRHCLTSATCCDQIGAANRHCYRAQCYATTRALVQALGLDADRASVSFQSRLGRTKWIEPYTDVLLPELAKAGVRRVAIMCPAFVADCLETVEEIGIRASEQWRALGGEALLLVPSLNAHPAWVAALADALRSRS